MDSLFFLTLLIVAWIFLVSALSTRYLHSKNPQVSPLYILFRTTRLNSLIDWISSKGRFFWRLFFDVGIGFAFILMIFGVLLFLVNLVLFFIGTPSAAGSGQSLTGNATSSVQPVGIVPIIPGVTISLDVLPYVIIAILISAVVHEFAHGISARVDGIELKSTGIFSFFLIFLGAFVEPDEKSFERAKDRSKLRVIAAGAFSNVVLAVVLFTVLITPLYQLSMIGFYNPDPSGVLIIDVREGTPAARAGLRADMVMVAITADNVTYPIRNKVQFIEFVQTVLVPNMKLKISLLDGRNITLISDVRPDVTIPEGEDPKPGTGFMGIVTWDYYEPRLPFLPLSLPFHYYQVLVYSFLLSLILALMNLLPIPLLDGDKFLQILLNRIEYARRNNLHSTIRMAMLFLFLANLVLSFLFFGWQPAI